MFADSSETLLSIVPETAWSAAVTTPAFKNVRFTGESLTHKIENTVSEEIRPDAEVSDLIQVGQSADGDLQFELSYDPTLQILLAAALRGDWNANVLKAAVLKPSFLAEKKFETGATDQIHRFGGVRVGNMNLSIQAKQKISGSFSVMASRGVAATTPIAGATYAAAGTNGVMAAPDVATITIGGIATPLFFTDLSIALNNNLRQQAAIGHLGLVGIGYGRREVTVNMTAYFEDGSLYDLFVAGAPASLAYSISDGANKYDIVLPRLKLTQGNVLAGGNNQDVMCQAAAQALVDPTLGTSIQITRTPGP